jgi:hypothetical protein
VRKIEQNYLVPLDYARRVEQLVKGQVTIDEIEEEARAQAKSLWPGLANALDRGETVASVTLPYKNWAAKVLGIPTETIDMTQPKWMRAIHNIDPKNGQPVSMALWEWDRVLKSDPVYKWDESPDAREKAAGFTTRLLSEFGRIAS